MIRALMMSLALLAACAPVGGGAQDEANAVPAPTPEEIGVRIGAAQDGETVEVAINERFAVELVGVPTAGYQWAPTTLPPFLTRAGEATGDTVREQSEPGFAGGNHWEVFMFAATNEGTGELVFEQRRPWETNQAAVDTFRVTIVAR